MLERHPPGQHFPTCSSPDNCLEYLAMLTETPTQTALRCAVENAKLMRANSIRSAEQSTRKTAREWADYFGQLLRGYGSVVTTTPNPYARAVRRGPLARSPFDDPGYNPHGKAPNGYAIAVKQMKENKR
jgi:hypothetical protein